MKINKIMLVMMGGALLATSCNDLNEQDYEGGNLSQNELEATTSAIPSRVDATFAGMYSYLGKGGTSGLTYSGVTGARPDDFGFPAFFLSQDLEGSDASCANNDYNWFEVADEYSSRNANYANPYERYVVPYIQIGVANQIISSYPANTTDSAAVWNIAGARAVRAFDYLNLAPMFQFSYETSADKPCVPIIGASGDPTHNPRATVKEVYDSIMSDLNYAVEHLAGYNRPNKQYIDQNVAYGLRARANLLMGNWAAAASDAEHAMEGYTPASREEVSTPGFDDISSHNWMWGVTKTPNDMLDNGGYGTYQNATYWYSAFTGNGQAVATTNVPVINKLLYDKIPSTDIRKGWWLDANKHSDNWKDFVWVDPGNSSNVARGDQLADFVIADVKTAMLPYTNIKFGLKAKVANSDGTYRVGVDQNTNDYPLMRVEEMILIQAEGLLKSGNEARARQVLENFVRTYRDPNYSANGRGLSLADEIWFQRRVELWGEGFAISDIKRLNKPLVRFHEGVENNFPDAFQFNMNSNDGYLNMRFPQTELDNNKSVEDNTDGNIPVPGQNGNLRDGVTD